MARPRSTGVNVVNKRRPDGTTVSYFYDRATKAFLGHDRAAAEQMMRVKAEPSAATLDPADRTLGAIITIYKGSARFKSRADSTRDSYRRDLDWLRTTYGDIPVRAFRPSSIERIRMSLEATPRKANKTMAMLSIVLGLAAKLEWIPTNPTREVDRLSIPPRAQLWTAEQEARFLDGARWELQLAAMLLLYTVQRPSDVLAMTLGQVTERDGRLWIALKQAKTGALVDVPVHERLEPHLRTRMALKIQRGPKMAKGIAHLLVPSPKTLEPWARRNFARAWDLHLVTVNAALTEHLVATGKTENEAADAVKAEHRQRRDFRRTGIVRLAEAGATTPQIAAISGHGIDYCQRIIDTYLPRRSEVALGGIEAWERQAAKRTVITLPSLQKRWTS